MTIVLELPAYALPHDQDLTPEVLAILVHKELTRFAAALDGVPGLDEAEAIQIPAWTAFRLLALATADLKCIAGEQRSSVNGI